VQKTYRLHLVPPAEPPAAAVERHIDWLVEEDLHKFACHLETARVLWRHCRELVEADQLPDRFKTVLMSCGYALDEDRTNHYCGVLDHDYRERRRHEAVESARREHRKNAKKLRRLTPVTPTLQ
jgi:hypothetical protein